MKEILKNFAKSKYFDLLGVALVVGIAIWSGYLNTRLDKFVDWGPWTSLIPLGLISVINVGIGKELLKGKKLLDILKSNSYPNPFEQLNIVGNLKRDEIKSSSYVVDSLIAAIWSLLNTDNYKDAVLTAVNLGEDTDSIAAITGALAGIIYGYEEIPKEWIDKIPNKEILNEALI